MTDVSRLVWQIMPPTEKMASFRWMLAIGVGVALFPVFGSSVSVGVVGGAAVAWILLLMAPWRFLPLTNRERAISWVVGGYVAIGLFTALIQVNPLGGVVAVAGNLGFLLILPLLPVLRHYRDDYWEQWFGVALIVGGMLAGGAALASTVLLGDLRAEALSGNPLIFAYLSGVMACLNGWQTLASSGRIQKWYALATASGFVAVALSGSRGTAAALVAVTIAAVFWRVAADTRHWRRVGRWIYALTVALAACYVALMSFSTARYAIEISLRRFALLDEHFFDALISPGSSPHLADSNLSVRGVMLKAGWQAFLDRPIFGHGWQNVMEVASQAAGGTPLPFTHLHNAFLTEAVASGIVGLSAFCAMLALPIFATRAADAPWRGLAVLLAVFTALCGLTNIGFHHDIKMFSYCLFVVAFNALTMRGATITPSQAADYCGFVRRNAASFG